MDENRIKVWKFADAPAELKAGYYGNDTPEWLALVPRSMKAEDLDEAIRGHSAPGKVYVHKTEAGDFVYSGSVRIDTFMQALASATVYERDHKS